MEERKVISLLAPGVDEEEMAKKADLVDGKVPASQLPSYVDDVVEYENVAEFPEDGEQGKIYVALDSGFTYRWSGSEYIQIGGQDLSDYYTKGEADQLLDTKQPVGDYATNSALEAGLAGKQDVGDYATNTALTEGLATKQPVGDYATNTALTEGLATKQDVGDYATNTALVEGLATKQDAGDYATSAELTAGLETKQDNITDLDTIRSGAAAGATAVQPGEIGTISTEDVRHLFDIVAKGSIVKFDAFGDGTLKRFKVLKCVSNIATLMAVDEVNAQFNLLGGSSQTGIFEDGSSYAQYAGGLLDTAMNTTYYNSLSAKVKTAIVATNRVQSCYRTEAASASVDPLAKLNVRKPGDGQYVAMYRITQKTIGNRNCFALDIDDIVEYFNTPNGGFIEGGSDLMLLFANTITRRNGYYSWLTSASAVDSRFALGVYGSDAILGSTMINVVNTAHPAFNINLSQIDFIVEE